MTYHNLNIPYERIANFCGKHHIREFALFGSILRDDFSDESDVDVLVTFEHGCGYSLFELAQIQSELEKFFGRKVDLVEKASLKNPYRRKEILNNMEVLYAA